LKEIMEAINKKEGKWVKPSNFIEEDVDK